MWLVRSTIHLTSHSLFFSPASHVRHSTRPVLVLFSGTLTSAMVTMLFRAAHRVCKAADDASVLAFAWFRSDRDLSLAAAVVPYAAGWRNDDRLTDGLVEQNIVPHCDIGTIGTDGHGSSRVMEWNVYLRRGTASPKHNFNCHKPTQN